MTFPANLNGPIEIVANAIAAIERHEHELGAHYAAARKRQRKQHHDRIRMLLPDLSCATLQRLQREVPAFASLGEVSAAFATHRAVWGLFKPAGYRNAHTGLQARLQRHMALQGPHTGDDRIVLRLQGELARTAKQQSTALTLLRRLKQAQRTGAACPPEFASWLRDARPAVGTPIAAHIGEHATSSSGIPTRVVRRVA